MSSYGTLKQPLSSLAQDSPDVTTYKVSQSNVFSGGSFVTYLIWFIIIAIIVWVILIATKPSWVQKRDEVTGQPNGIVDQARAITWAIVIALVITIIIWIIRAATSNKNTVTKTTEYVF